MCWVQEPVSSAIASPLTSADLTLTALTTETGLPHSPPSVTNWTLPSTLRYCTCVSVFSLGSHSPSSLLPLLTLYCSSCLDNKFILYSYMSWLAYTFTGMDLISCPDPSGVSVFVYHGVNTSKVPHSGPQYQYCTQSSWGGNINYNRRNNSNSYEVSAVLPRPPSVQDHPQTLPQSSRSSPQTLHAHHHQCYHPTQLSGNF